MKSKHRSWNFLDHKSWIFILILAIGGIILIRMPQEPAFPPSLGDRVGLVYSQYTGFSDPEAGFSLNRRIINFNASSNTQVLTVNVLDAAVYSTGYYSFSGTDRSWKPFSLTGTAYGTNWISGRATSNINIPRSAISTGLSNDNYVLIYSCNWSNRRWFCYDERWQIIQFTTNVTSQVCVGSNTRSCFIANGTGTQNMTCNLGTWSSPYGACYVLGCNEGYTPRSDNLACVLNLPSEPSELPPPPMSLPNIIAPPGTIVGNTGLTWTPELMINRDFENGDFEGWTVVTGTSSGWAVSEHCGGTIYASPKSGSYQACFNGDNDASGVDFYIYQDVSLASYAGYIDNGNAVIDASGWWVSSEYKSYGIDYARIQIMFLDSNKNIISTALDTGYLDNENDVWDRAGVSSHTVPRNTRYVRIWGTSYEDCSGIDCNCYCGSGSLDLFSVKLGYNGSTSTTVPTCTSVQTLCGGVCQPNPQDCTSSIVNATYASRTGSCSSANTWSYGACTLSTCISGFTPSGNTCVKAATTLADTTAPTITFDSTTPSNGATVTSSTQTISATISDSSYVSSWIDLDNSLLLWMRLDNSHADSSPVGWTTSLNGPISYTSGKFGSSATGFTESNFINVNPALDYASTDMTISFWVNVKDYAYPERQNPFGKAFGGDGTLTMESSGTMNFYFGSAGADDMPYNSPSSSLVATPNVWENWMIVRNTKAHTVQWYKNGEVASSLVDYSIATEYDAAITNVVHSTNPLTIGDSYMNPLNGAIDEFMIFKRALTSSEVKSLYDSRSNKFSATLTGLTNGQHSYTVYALDAAGNLQKSTRTFTVNTGTIVPTCTSVQTLCGGVCQPNPQDCTSSIVNATYASRTGSCSSANTWSYGACTLSTCISGFTPSGNTCIKTATTPSPYLNVDYITNFSAAAGNDYFYITSNGAWTVSASASWITISRTSGTGNASVLVNVTANTGALRSGSVTVTGSGYTRVLSFNQAAGTTVPTCNTTTQTLCNNVCQPKTQDCKSTITNASSAVRTGSCTNNVWSYGACVLSACVSGYHTSGNTCVQDSTTPVTTGYILINNTNTDLSKIPSCWMAEARKMTLHYAHTSHGERLFDADVNAYDGMDYLESQNPTLYGYEARKETTEGLPSGTNILRIYDGNPSETYIAPEDYWNSADGRSRTSAVVSTGRYDASMWAWCGQMDDTNYDLNLYTSTMKNWESQYPGTRFILMTGHHESENILGTSNYGTRAKQIIDYAKANNMVVFDYGSFEAYDPDGKFYNYPTGYGCRWCDEWCGTHASQCQGMTWGCAHVEDGTDNPGILCLQYSKATWWMMARLAGWDGTPTDACP